MGVPKLTRALRVTEGIMPSLEKRIKPPEPAPEQNETPSITTIEIYNRDYWQCGALMKVLGCALFGSTRAMVISQFQTRFVDAKFNIQ
jgi:hypothetical protein